MKVSRESAPGRQSAKRNQMTLVLLKLNALIRVKGFFSVRHGLALRFVFVRLLPFHPRRFAGTGGERYFADLRCRIGRWFDPGSWQT